MRKKAFTLLELIFVIIIIGVLSGVAFRSFKPHYLRSDVNFVLMKLEDTRYKAMGYDKLLAQSDVNYSIGCIDIDDLNKTDDAAYAFRSALKNRPFDVICFDTLGRAYKDDNKTALNSLFSKDIVLTYRYNDTKEANVTIDHLSGAIRIFW